MSSAIYIASDIPLVERPNPHDKLLSVNEALALGIRNIPKYLLEEGFDRNKPNVILVSDREININIDTDTIEDGNFDDDFAVWLTEKSPEMRTNKEYCAFFEWARFTTGRALQFIEYLKEQLENTTEIELWHTWLDDASVHHMQQKEISISDLKPEDIAVFEKEEVWQEPYYTDYVYIITR